MFLVLNFSVIIVVLGVWCELVWALPAPSHGKRVGQTLTASVRDLLQTCGLWLPSDTVAFDVDCEVAGSMCRFL